MSLQQKDLSRLLETGIVAARLAGQHAMEESYFVKTSVKNKTELVTQADAQCQQIIISKIKETYPDHGFLAEEGVEGKVFKQPPRGGKPIWWVIDPIDGTNNFAHYLPLFSVSIAVMYEGLPVIGVIFDPATDSMFTAVKDGQAQLNGRRISAGEDAIDKFSSIGLDSHFENALPGWTQDLILKTRFRNLGSTALHFAYVAKGSLIAAIVNKPKLWDIAAGAVICESAGAVVSDWKGNKLFPISVDSYESEPMQAITANQKTHDELLKLLSSEG